MLKFLLKAAALVAGTGLVLNAIKVHEEKKEKEEHPEVSSHKPEEDKKEA